ncbi:polycystic kidney disease 1-like 2-like [Paramuricea clavata]|uniref:Polycystic kidney disease 1-like 2-like n=1 Tax=Paramuricea clavata TaxID=317549 RepID=A0A6S7L3H2_PARCT|nr:polycystic kidney disease 1-like 2-like [Paramuricea clavata]
MVKFIKRETKEEFHQGKKQLFHKTTKYIELARLSDNRVFNAEGLSPRNKELFALSLKLKEDKKFKFIWTHSGRIYLRKDNDSPDQLITSQDDSNYLR